jgi:hypothetical protein
MRDGEAHRLPRTWHALSGGRIISLSDSQLEMVTHLRVQCRSRTAVYRRALLSGFRFQMLSNPHAVSIH